MTNHAVGLAFENVAKFYLRCNKFNIIDSRIKYKCGEIDILANKGDDMYIFEVKKRKSYDDAIMALNPKGLKRSINAFFQHQEKHNLKYNEVFIKGIVFDESVYPQIVDIDDVDLN